MNVLRTVSCLYRCAIATSFASTLFLGSAGNLSAQIETKEPTASLCAPHVLDEKVVATWQQRLEAGNIARPTGIVGPTGFDWSDTQLGIVKRRDGAGYLFFGSDGSCHGHCGTAEERDGSITRTVGTLDDPLGTKPPREFILPQSTQFKENSIVYVGGGPVLRVPDGHPGAGNLLVVYQAARLTDLVNQDGEYTMTGVAKSTDEGLTWTDLGLIVSANVPFKRGAAPSVNEYDGGTPGNLVPDASGRYFYYYFPDKVKSGGVGGSDLTFFSVARVPMDEFLRAAFDCDTPRALPFFEKYYQGKWDQPGLGGLSTSVLNPQSSAGDPVVTWSYYLKRYVVIFDDTQTIGYADSEDGLHWPSVQRLTTASSAASVLYAAPAGKGDDAGVVGKEFYIFYTYYPNQGGWGSASIRRLNVECENRIN